MGVALGPCQGLRSAAGSSRPTPPAEAREGQGLVAYFSSHRMCGKRVLGIEAALREAEKALKKYLDSGVAAQRRPFNRGVETRRRSSRYSVVASEAP